MGAWRGLCESDVMRSFHKRMRVGKSAGDLERTSIGAERPLNRAASGCLKRTLVRYRRRGILKRGPICSTEQRQAAEDEKPRVVRGRLCASGIYGARLLTEREIRSSNEALIIAQGISCVVELVTDVR